MSVTGCFALLTSPVTCDEFLRCYGDVGICLWTNGLQLTQSAAEEVCQQRNNSFLPRVTNSNIQEKLRVFRSDAWELITNLGFWIDVSSTSISNFHWIDGSPLAGWSVFVLMYSGTCPCKTTSSLSSTSHGKPRE